MDDSTDDDRDEEGVEGKGDLNDGNDDLFSIDAEEFWLVDAFKRSGG